MDLLSGAAQNVCKSSENFLKSIKNAPKELLDLIDGFEQIEAVLEEVKSACTQEERSTQSLDRLIERAKAKLLELDKLINYNLVKPKETVEANRFAWARHRKSALDLKEYLRNIQLTIALALDASNL
jgi:hypothetical protein